MSVVIETTIGDITVDLFVKERPKACLNFLKLCKIKYYNFNLFHRVEQGFIAQTGDPTGDGDKGDSIWGVLEGPKKRYFEAERLPKILHSVPGLLSMVSTGENFIGSQFFFTLGADITSLDIHCVIGEVTEGHEVLRQLNESIVDDKHRPFKDIRITHTVILEDPYADPRGFKQPSRSPSPTPERLKNGRIAADEDIDDTQGKTEAEVQEMLQEREAKARATILEIVGDLPDADVAPPENVLFVCKLNPVTTDDDLQIIFSRFGMIKTCEVIRDKSSGDSLQYAFIEFEEQKSCEDAYFKMDNVLIDDRRIHVDFSQSVSKIKWKGKGNYTIHDDSDMFKSEKGKRRQPAIRRSRSASPRRPVARARSPRRSRSPWKPRNSNRDRENSPWRPRSPRRSPPRRNRSPPRRNWAPHSRSDDHDDRDDDRSHYELKNRRRTPPRKSRYSPRRSGDTKRFMKTADGSWRSISPASKNSRLLDTRRRSRSAERSRQRSNGRSRRDRSPDRSDFRRHQKSSSKSSKKRRTPTSESSSSSYDRKKSSRKDRTKSLSKRRRSSSSSSSSSNDRRR